MAYPAAPCRRPSSQKAAFTGRDIPFTVWANYGGNLAEFQKAAHSGGHFNPLVNFDGISRRVPMIAELDGAYYESLSLAMARALLGFPPVELGMAPEGALQQGYPPRTPSSGCRVGKPFTPFRSTTARALVPYRGSPRTFHYISLAESRLDGSRRASSRARGDRRHDRAGPARPALDAGGQPTPGWKSTPT